MPQTEADATVNGVHDRLDAIVIGAGFAGMYMVHRLRELGFTVHGFEAGDDVGGTWYWNRYPGARCDSESMYYSYSFLPDLEQEWPLDERYPGQPVILKYLRHVADRLQLRDYFTFNAKVVSSSYDDDANTWTVRTEDGTELRATVPDHRGGMPVDGQQAGLPGRRELRRAVAAHRQLAARAGGPDRPEGRRHRHRRVGHPGHPGDRRAGRAPDRVPAHGPVHHPGRERPAEPRVRRDVEAELPGMAAAGAALARRHPLPGQRDLGAGGLRRRAHAPPSRARGSRAGSCSPGHLLRPGGQRGSQPDGRRFRPVQDRARSCTTRRWPRCSSPGRSRSGPSGCRSTRTTTRPSTGPTSRWSTCVRRRSRRSPGPGSGPPRATTTWTSSCTPPGSTR